MTQPPCKAQTRQRQALDRMAAFGGFQCPLCRQPLAAQGTSLRCPGGHTYDVARKGYVYLHHKIVSTPYDQALFEARRAVLEAGFFGPLVEVLTQLLGPLSPKAVLDAGCGEGYYLSRLAPALPGCFFVGLDIAKEAILAAASRGESPLYCVGDLKNLPFGDGVFDAVLNILSPAHYAGFERVLSKEGVLVKVMPGREYLREIRKRLPVPQAPYDDALVPAHLSRRMQVLRRERLRYTRPLSPQDFARFAAMTPLTQGLTPQELQALSLRPASRITIDLQWALCKKKADA